MCFTVEAANNPELGASQGSVDGQKDERGQREMGSPSKIKCPDHQKAFSECNIEEVPFINGFSPLTHIRTDVA